VITKQEWNDIIKSFEKALGKGSVKLFKEQEIAFIYYKEQGVSKPVAIVRSSEKSNKETVHFSLSTMPGIAAFVGCMLFRHIDFVISDHFYLAEDGRFLNETEGMDYLKTKKYFFDKEIKGIESKEDYEILKEIKRKDLLN
jgi:hypothetical protein